MSRSVQATLFLLLLLSTAAGTRMVLGQDEADRLEESQLPEGPQSLATATEASLEQPLDLEELESNAAVEAAVDSPIDSLFDSSTDYIATLGTPGAVTDGAGPLAPVPEQSEGQGIFQRRRLTGDWWGRRTALQKNGIRYRGRVTQYFFGVDGGIQPPVPPQLARFGIQGGTRSSTQATRGMTSSSTWTSLAARITAGSS